MPGEPRVTSSSTTMSTAATSGTALLHDCLAHIASATQQYKELSERLDRYTAAVREIPWRTDEQLETLQTVASFDSSVKRLLPTALRVQKLERMLEQQKYALLRPAFEDLLQRLRRYDARDESRSAALDGFDASGAANSAASVWSEIRAAALTLNALCIILIGLQDRSSEIPPERIAAPNANALAQGSRPAEMGLDGPELGIEQGISDDDLVRQLEVRQRTLLNGISRTTVALAAIESERSELVEQARRLEISWAKIGAAANVTSQAALRKWNADARRKHRSYNSGQAQVVKRKEG